MDRFWTFHSPGSGSRHDGYPNSFFLRKSANNIGRSNIMTLRNVLYPNSTTRMLLKVETYELSSFQTSWQRDVSPRHEHPQPSLRVSDRLVLHRKLTDFSSGRLFSRVHLFPGSGSAATRFVLPLQTWQCACIASHSGQLSRVLVSLSCLSSSKLLSFQHSWLVIL